MELWMARDKDDDLYLYNYKPYKNEDSGSFTCGIQPYGKWSEVYELERDLFPELTFENSPQEVEVKLVK